MHILLLLSFNISSLALSISPENEMIRRNLKLPFKARIQNLYHHKNFAFKELQKIVESESENFQTRWKALTAMANIYPKQSLPTLRKSLKSRHWFLKNAALISLKKINKREAEFWAIQFLSDPAMVLRLAAVNVLKESKSQKVKSLLKKELAQKENFRGKQSLWIRPHIVKALSYNADKTDIPYLRSLLKDSDKNVKKEARFALDTLKKQNHQF